MAKYDNTVTISADANWLPSLEGQPPKQDRQLAAQLAEFYRRDVPGQWSSNRYVQSQQYVGTQYIAIKATWSWLAGSSVLVEKERGEDEEPDADEDALDSGRAKALSRSVLRKASVPGGLGNDDRFHPVPAGDELARLFRFINPVDTFQDFIAQIVIQDFLTGNAHIWLPKNAEGRPSEMWVLPSVVLRPIVPGVSRDYPAGGYRINPNFNLGWASFGIPAIANVPLDARDVLHYREPHAFLRTDGYGATQAMARQIDVLNGVEISRASAMAKGVNGNMLITLEGASEEQCTALKRDLMKANGGPDRAGEPMVVGTEGGAVNPMMMSPADMAYEKGWEQSARSVLAGYRVPPVVAGLIEANYAEFWAAVRAWYAGELSPFAIRLGAYLTKHMAEPFYGPSYRVRLQLPKIEDPEALIQQHSFTPNDLYTVNEHRASLDMEPLEGGDVVPSQYAAANMTAMGFDATGRVPNAASDPESDRPKNTNGKGALPGRIKAHLEPDMAAVVDEILEAAT
jgi:hypothetical protein